MTSCDAVWRAIRVEIREVAAGPITIAGRERSPSVPRAAVGAAGGAAEAFLSPARPAFVRRPLVPHGVIRCPHSPSSPRPSRRRPCRSPTRRPSCCRWRWGRAARLAGGLPTRVQRGRVGRGSSGSPRGSGGTRAGGEAARDDHPPRRRAVPRDDARGQRARPVVHAHARRPEAAHQFGDGEIRGLSERDQKIELLHGRADRHAQGLDPRERRRQMRPRAARDGVRAEVRPRRTEARRPRVDRRGAERTRAQ